MQNCKAPKRTNSKINLISSCLFTEHTFLYGRKTKLLELLTMIKTIKNLKYSHTLNSYL